MHELAVILPAAGSSTRFGGPRSKVFETIAGRCVLWRSFDAFAQRPEVRHIVIAAPANLDWWQGGPEGLREQLAQGSPHCRVTFCEGGTCRAQSVWNAVKCVPSSIDWIAIHDAARPLVSQTLINRTVQAAVEHGAAVPAMPVALTIKQATGPLPALVEHTVPRHQLWAVQTPQVMRRTDWLDAAKRCPLPLDQITDDVQLLELAGKPVWLVEGDEKNLKITSRLDATLAQLLLAPLSPPER